jgi:hypothetical protein
MSDNFLDFVPSTDEVEESPAVKAAMEAMAKMETVQRPGPDGIETVRVEDLTPDERALLLGMLVKIHRDKLS